MLAFLLTLLIVSSVSFAVSSGDTLSVSSSLSDGAKSAIELCLGLSGITAFWCGIMKAAERSGVTHTATLILGKPLRKLFSGLDDPAAAGLITLNVTANMFGMGNAALPLALAAMKRLKAADGCRGRYTAFFIILNTASVQLLPVTAAAMRGRHGASDPWDILPASLLTSAAALAVGLTAAALLFPKEGRS